MTIPETDRAIKQAAAFIASQQRADGGFDTLVSSDALALRGAVLHPAVFVTALIGQRCAEFKGGQAILQPVSEYLLRHKTSAWSWNYWQRDKAGRRMPPYPDDLDDTACALAALAGYNPDVLDGDALGRIGQVLIALEANPGGPYRTWLVAADARMAWRDVDVAVNANVAGLFGRLGIRVPALERWLAEALASGSLHSRYYPTPLHVVYLLARNADDAQFSRLRRWLKTKVLDQSAANNALELAMVLAAACRAGCDLPLLHWLAHSLLEKRRGTHWPAAGFYIESNLKNQPIYGGSAALTTAVACEALSLYRARISLSTPKISPKAASVVSDPADTFQAIRHHSYGWLKGDVGRAYRQALLRIQNQDSDGQISGLADRLCRDMGVSLPHRQLQHLNTASINGWMAYTLYDDILDGDGEGALLIPATVALRQCVEYFRRALPKSPAFQAYVGQALLTVDTANAWELAHARVAPRDQKLTITVLPDYGEYAQLAHRSWGHALATSGVLAACGWTVGSPEMAAWHRFFHHFLIARQLNDDAHDWQEDLARGRISAVVALLLADGPLPIAIDVSHSLPDLQQRFWLKTIGPVCNLIQSHLDQADAALEACTFIADKTTYYAMTKRLRRAAEQSLRTRSEALAFMRSFAGRA